MQCVRIYGSVLRGRVWRGWRRVREGGNSPDLVLLEALGIQVVEPKEVGHLPQFGGVN